MKSFNDFRIVHLEKHEPPKYKLETGSILSEQEFNKLSALMPNTIWFVIHPPEDE